MMFQPLPQDVEDLFDCEFRDPSGTRCVGTVRLRIGLEGVTIENQNGVLGKFAFTRILSWSTTDDKCFTFTVKTVQKTKQDITVWGPPQLIQAISDAVDAKVARLMVLKKEGFDINDLKSPPNPAAGTPLMQMPMHQPQPQQQQPQGKKPFKALSKLFSPKSKQPNVPPQNGFFPPGMPTPQGMPGMPPGMPGMPGMPGPPGQIFPQFTPQQQQQYPGQQQQQIQAPNPQQAAGVGIPPPPAPQQQQQQLTPKPQLDPVPEYTPQSAAPTPVPAPRSVPAQPKPAPRTPAPAPPRTEPRPPPPAYGGEYNFSPEADKSELQRTLSQTREYAHKMKEALMQRDEQVIEANKKVEEACSREEATSSKVKALEEQLKNVLQDVESIKRNKLVESSGGGSALVPYAKGPGEDEEGSLYQTFKEEAEALRKANSMLREQNHHLRTEQGGEPGAGKPRRVMHKKQHSRGHNFGTGDEEARHLRSKVSELEDENSRLLKKLSDQERLLQDYEATVAQSMPGDSGGMFLGGYETPYSTRPSDPMQQLKSLMGEAYLVKMALKKKANPSNMYVIESLDNWIMASHKLKKVCTF
ncbi:hypothetical protein HOP50_01g03520 [Chloropicon primus]|uniref:Uncharacterized protein n=1 Tax=Chloropicon primus TaxID=1764295 RepID=A0A5B8MDX5_9CHLO|nr:hypothetical protein A3770_01p03630 [Chloropicon primus]UPQ97061.1 hypothetical protein HOP50_01g03520 [Chloropicon primus]|eukprot:QDZ17845.1 hypothetical protein A3770_01p03630 [Chloropicon primus]